MPRQPAQKKTAVEVSLLLAGKTYKASGKTAKDALLKLQPPFSIKAGVLTIKKGKKSREKIVYPQVINRLFREQSPTLREIALKNVGILFNDIDG